MKIDKFGRWQYGSPPQIQLQVLIKLWGLSSSYRVSPGRNVIRKIDILCVEFYVEYVIPIVVKSGEEKCTLYITVFCTKYSVH